MNLSQHAGLQFGDAHGGDAGRRINPTNLTHVWNVKGSGTSVTIPSTAQAGDLAMVWVFDLTNTRAPTGWIRLLTSDASGNLQDISQFSYVAVRILEDGDPGSSISLNQGFSATDAVVVGFRPDRKITSIGVPHRPTLHRTTGNPSAQHIHPAQVSSKGLGLAFCIYYENGGTVSPRTWTGGTPTEITDYANEWYMKYRVDRPGATKVDVDVDQADEGSQNVLLSGYLLFGGEDINVPMRSLVNVGVFMSVLEPDTIHADHTGNWAKWSPDTALGGDTGVSLARFPSTHKFPFDDTGTGDVGYGSLCMIVDTGRHLINSDWGDGNGFAQLQYDASPEPSSHGEAFIWSGDTGGIAPGSQPFWDFNPFNGVSGKPLVAYTRWLKMYGE